MLTEQEAQYFQKPVTSPDTRGGLETETDIRHFSLMSAFRIYQESGKISVGSMSNALNRFLLSCQANPLLRNVIFTMDGTLLTTSAVFVTEREQPPEGLDELTKAYYTSVALATSNASQKFNTIVTNEALPQANIVETLIITEVLKKGESVIGIATFPSQEDDTNDVNSPEPLDPLEF